MKFIKNIFKQDCIDFSDELIFTKDQYGIFIEEGVNVGVKVQNHTSTSIYHKRNRISKFLYALPMLWKFCK